MYRVSSITSRLVASVVARQMRPRCITLLELASQEIVQGLRRQNRLELLHVSGKSEVLRTVRVCMRICQGLVMGARGVCLTGSLIGFLLGQPLTNGHLDE